METDQQTRLDATADTLTTSEAIGGSVGVFETKCLSVSEPMVRRQRHYGSSTTTLRFVGNDITARGQRSYVSTAATSFMPQKLFSQHNFIKISYSDKVYQESGATENLDNALDGNTKKGLR